jgi:hypothetical protein
MINDVQIVIMPNQKKLAYFLVDGNDKYLFISATAKNKQTLIEWGLEQEAAILLLRANAGEIRKSSMSVDE